MCVCIYIYIHIEREGERYTHTHVNNIFATHRTHPSAPSGRAGPRPRVAGSPSIFLSVHLYVYLSISLSLYIYIYVLRNMYTYIYRERERMYIYIYIYIYMYEEGPLWWPHFWHMLCWKRCSRLGETLHFKGYAVLLWGNTTFEHKRFA